MVPESIARNAEETSSNMVKAPKWRLTTLGRPQRGKTSGFTMSFNTRFIKENRLEDSRSLDPKFDNTNQRIHFEFRNDDSGDCELETREGGGKRTKRIEPKDKYRWLEDVLSKDNTQDRQFPINKTDDDQNSYYISVK